MINLLPQTIVYGGRLKDRNEKANSSGGTFSAISKGVLELSDFYNVQTEITLWRVAA